MRRGGEDLHAAILPRKSARWAAITAPANHPKSQHFLSFWSLIHDHQHDAFGPAGRAMTDGAEILALATADLRTKVAVTEAEMHAHAKLDDERFGRILADITHIKNGQTQNSQAYRDGIERVHDRIDVVVTAQAAMKVTMDMLPETVASSIRESASSMKLYVVGLILSAGGMVAWELIKTFVLHNG